MPVNMDNIKARYLYAMEQVGVNGTLLINEGPGNWREYPSIRMIFRKFSPDELLGPVDQANMVCMILSSEMPAGVTKLTTRDRIRTDEGREFTVQKGDFVNREVQGETMMVEASVKG